MTIALFIVIGMMNRENNLSNIINTVTSWFKNEFFTIFKKKKIVYLSAPAAHDNNMIWMNEWMNTNFPAILKIYLLAQMRPASTKCPTHLKAIIIVVVGTLQIPNQYKQNGKSSTLGSFFDWLIDQSIN